MGGGSGTLAETSDNSMTTYRTQETDPFGSASFGGVTGNTFWEYMGNILFHKYTEYP